MASPDSFGIDAYAASPRQHLRATTPPRPLRADTVVGVWVHPHRQAQTRGVIASATASAALRTRISAVYRP
jgi:hypothetical protein